jgi:hypothetical protein
MSSLRLAKAGYGSMGDMLNTPIDEFMLMLHYEKFLGDYERAWQHLNIKKPD